MMDDLAQRREEHLKVLQAEVERLVEELQDHHVHQVILFGSMARGEANLLSDLDMIVVMDSDLPFVERMGRFYEEMRPRCADILVYTPDEFEQMKETSPLVKHALKTGRVLYAATQ